jgi:amino acid adenylation domain-containing protein
MEYLLSHLLANSVARHPHREALRKGGEALTYAQLNQRANQVARTLKAAGVRRGDRVGIYVHKSFASVIGVFGILKAGAAYVPLDPNAPARRLAYITRDCGIQVILTSPVRHASLPEFFAEGTPLKTVVLMENPLPVHNLTSAVPLAALPDGVRAVDWDTVCAEDCAAIEANETIETDLAYVLYTSGSTGSPKGVMISHRTIFTFLNWCQDTFCLSPEDRITSHAPLHFDLSTFDLFATIQAGATVVLVEEHLSTLPVQLADLLQNERITVTYLVPSILSLMVNFGKLAAHDFSSLRAILFAGEVFPMKYLRRLAAAIPNAAYYNLYGPTETNVCTYYRVLPRDLLPERGDQPVPIGRACENIEVFAVTEDGRRVTEPGEEGELWARGSCVAQGYWGDKEKTARTFVQNPFQPLYPDPAYRTGDIVKLAEDRVNWIYTGRRDHMVKSRGYRVELGEIENALYRHEAVKEAAVVAIPDELLGNRLRAFVAPAPGSTLTAKELKVFCAQHVPGYMVPEAFEFRDILPKTSSGKIDRTALAEAKTARPPGPSRVAVSDKA